MALVTEDEVEGGRRWSRKTRKMRRRRQQEENTNKMKWRRRKISERKEDKEKTNKQNDYFTSSPCLNAWKITQKRLLPHNGSEGDMKTDLILSYERKALFVSRVSCNITHNHTSGLSFAYVLSHPEVSGVCSRSGNPDTVTLDICTRIGIYIY
jgi:hypothetical protein